LRAEYDDRIAQLQRCKAEDGNRSGGVATPQYQQLQQQALSRERDTIIQLRNKHVINDDALRRIQRDLDLAEVRLFGE
jgi:monovalent cation/hydrogen antiporter